MNGWWIALMVIVAFVAGFAAGGLVWPRFVASRLHQRGSPLG